MQKITCDLFRLTRQILDCWVLLPLLLCPCAKSFVFLIPVISSIVTGSYFKIKLSHLQWACHSKHDGHNDSIQDILKVFISVETNEERI